MAELSGAALTETGARAAQGDFYPLASKFESETTRASRHIGADARACLVNVGRAQKDQKKKKSETRVQTVHLTTAMRGKSATFLSWLKRVELGEVVNVTAVLPSKSK